MDDITLPDGPCWFSPNYKHNLANTKCTYYDKYDGIYCDNTVTVRRLVMYHFEPTSLQRQKLWILPYDDSIVNSFPTEEDYETYLSTQNNWEEERFYWIENPN